MALSSTMYPRGSNDRTWMYGYDPRAYAQGAMQWDPTPVLGPVPRWYGPWVAKEYQGPYLYGAPLGGGLSAPLAFFAVAGSVLVTIGALWAGLKITDALHER